MDDERRTGEVRYFGPIPLTVWNADFAAHDLHHGQAQLRRNAGALELCLERSRGARRFLPLGSSSTRSVDSHAAWTLYRRGLAEPGCRSTGKRRVMALVRAGGSARLPAEAGPGSHPYRRGKGGTAKDTPGAGKAPEHLHTYTYVGG